MVVLAAIELAAKEVFDYNREAFTYDEEQRLKRDICLLSLQVERFDLFREDIEDLVKLTVDKMDMYHLVGALFLSFTATMFTEGRIHGGVVPPFFAGIYLLSIASSFVYLLLAVWLSMHASISSHGYGVRLRCRFIRLPIPTSKQLARVSTTLAEFEQCGLRNTMRIPFGPDPAQHWNNDVAEELSVGTNGDVVGRHVQLFRKLQAKWQCFDAYARVCMAFGVNQIVESICYYLIGVTLIQRCAPATCAALLVVFQATAVVLSALDIVSLKQWQVIALQAFGSTPVWVTFVALVCGKRDSTKVLKTSNAYYLPVVAFLTKALWLQLLLWLAEPSEDEAALPRSFRAVLFLDVFGDVACDPTNEEASLTTQGFNAAFEEQAAVAERALNIAHTALRRWEAVPVDEMSHSHGSELRRLREDILVWRRLLSTSLKRYYTSRGMCGEVDSLEDTRSWGSLTLAEQLEDNFPGFLVGPLAGDCFYNLEAGEVIRTNVNFETLRLDEVAAFVGRAEGAVRLALATCGENGEDGADDGHEVSEDAEGIVSDNSEDRRTTDISGSSSQVDQLPWKLVRRMTHLMQFVHVLLAVAEALELFGYVDMDHVLPEDVGRRLGFGRESDASLVFSDDGAVAAGWTHFNLSRVQVAWPFGDWFQPASLACLPVPPFASPLGIIVGSPALLYWAEVKPATPQLRELSDDERRLELRSALPRASYPPGATALCASPSVWPVEADAEKRANVTSFDDLCLWGALEGESLALWSFGKSRRDASSQQGVAILRVQGRKRWRLLAGAIIPCTDVAALLHSGGVAGWWCLVLVGWDGDSVPLAALPLHDGHLGPPATLPTASELVVAQASAPIPLALVAVPVVALHVQPRSGRLWLLHATGDMRAWNVLRLQPLGSWRASWLSAPATTNASQVAAVALLVDSAASDSTSAGELLPAAVCEDARGALLLVVAGTRSHGPVLLRSPGLPYVAA